MQIRPTIFVLLFSKLHGTLSVFENKLNIRKPIFVHRVIQVWAWKVVRRQSSNSFQSFLHEWKYVRGKKAREISIERTRFKIRSDVRLQKYRRRWQTEWIFFYFKRQENHSVIRSRFHSNCPTTRQTTEGKRSAANDYRVISSWPGKVACFLRE
jgi:hypothetical protein